MERQVGKMKNRDFVCKVVLFQTGVYFCFKLFRKVKDIFLRILLKSETITALAQKADMYEKWIGHIQDENKLGEYFISKNVKNVVICIWNKTAELFVNEIKSLVNIEAIVDADRDLNQPFKVENSLDRIDGKNVDLIVVMEPEAYDDYYKEFHNEFRCPIVSIDELIARL